MIVGRKANAGGRVVIMRPSRSFLAILPIALLLAGYTAGAQEAQVESLVPNAGAEDGAGDQPDGWSFYAWEKEQSRGWWADEHAFSGSRSLGMQGLNSGWSTVVPVEPESVCSVSFRYRAEGGPSRAVVYVRHPVGGREQEVILYRPVITIPHDQPGDFVDGVWVGGADERGWVLAEVGNFIPPAGVDQVSLLIKLVSEEPGAMLWLDDVVVSSQPRREVEDTARILARFDGGALWTDNENRKILPERELPEAAAEAVEISAARGEYESFQLAVTFEGGAQGADCTWTDLTGPATIPASALICRRIEHVDIQRPEGPFGHRGLNPDPLTEQLPVDIPAGFNQGFWFTLQVPRDQQPGEYTCEVTVRSGGQELTSAPVRLLVRDFEMPLRPSIDVRSSFRYPLVLERESGDPADVIRRYYVDIFAHGSRCAPAARVNLQVQGDTVEVDAAEYIEHLKLMRDQFGATRVDVPIMWISHRGDHVMPPDAAWQGIPIFADEELTQLNPAFVAPFRDFVTKLTAQMRDAGVLQEPTVRFIDEPRLAHEPTRSGIRAISELLLEIEPELRIAQTVSSPHQDLMDVTRVWVLHTDNWDRAAGEIARARAEGDEIMVYNNGVNYPDHRPIRVRLWPWMLRKYEVDGTYSWWGTVCWRGEMQDPWTAGFGSSGVLLYPPRTPDEQGPIDSIRWELFREGLEDFEYMRMADELADRLEAAGKADAAKPGRDAVAAALALVERWPTVRGANDEPYTLDVTAVAAARDALAEAIVNMQAAE